MDIFAWKDLKNGSFRQKPWKNWMSSISKSIILVNVEFIQRNTDFYEIKPKKKFDDYSWNEEN